MQVLVVEDERPLAEVIRRGLVDAGMSVSVVHDGEAALWAARERSFDVVLLDIMLPGISGYDVLARLRALDAFTPVLMLTARDADTDQVSAFELGADDYLPKPFSFAVLVARVRALARRSGGGERTGLLAVGDLRLDAVSHQAFRGDAELALTVREFALLEFLMENAGTALTKDAIATAVWGADFEGDVNVVEVYVGYLRRKIDVPFERAAVETVRGLGYRLSATGG